MFEIRTVTEGDKAFGFSLDEHISEGEFLLKCRDACGYVIADLIF